MSSGGGYQGGRTRMGTKVFLNIYDLAPVNEYLYPVGFGLHHSGVEILGQEYSFASGAGIFDSTPKEAPNARFRETIEMGTFQGGSSELSTIIHDLRSDFGPDKYNLIKQNCNHFANALIWALLGRVIPAHVNRLADIGTCLSCLIPKKLLEEAPVGPNGGNSSNTTSGYQVYGRNRENSSTNVTAQTSAFAGSGSKLSSKNNSDNSSSRGFGILFRGNSTNNDKGNDDLTDRREKARKAALARMDEHREEGL
mmetsp:Transcript_20441/g.19660  ORF Transcript_20441/g.19660 Transcript_20441/m.19660 type:complete len:253 (-) Transcript_20441:133-891(-)|eukprot:CAMPEP_0197834844 /NCGR_PEP_ID=MMETSP1437-20131217/23923_1 /TAXON_ID=49252 ORGANISM="Eucampia antarctica, Strain CCMP1452" /NCGR_SAMPLE_ID=MMETSP1437 /ASSEMBLY_ACC=CAM_ASM_001096 /LENGTH=252 /DNA_ID=CAMNT_0043439865 /DNA_START=94 /DNA_END=852 /DNA_ORIENTATION=+